MKEYGLQTSPKACERLYQKRVEALLEYKELQIRSRKCYCWYKEAEVQNLLDAANVCRKNKKYQYGIEKLMNQLYPKTVRAGYIRTIGHLIDIINKAYKEYDVSCMESIHNILLQDILNELKLSDLVTAKQLDVKEGPIRISKAENAVVYSYIPYDMPQQEFLVKSMRYVREMVSYIEEYGRFLDKSHIYPCVGVNLINTDFPSACADGDSSHGYYISVMAGLLPKLKSMADEIEIEEALIKIFSEFFPEEDIREQLYKYALYFIAAHEYGHIQNGDCEPNSVKRKDKEELADRRAIKLIQMVGGAQAKYHDKLYPNSQIFVNMAVDEGMFYKAIQMASELRDQLTSCESRR